MDFPQLIKELEDRIERADTIWKREDYPGGASRTKNENWGKFVAYSHCLRRINEILKTPNSSKKISNDLCPDVSKRTLGINSCAALIKSMPIDQAIQIMKSDITKQPKTVEISGELVVAYVPL